MLQPGDHVIDNRPGISDPTQAPILSDTSNFNLQDPNNDLYKFNSTRGGVIVPRGTSLIGLDLRKTKILPKFIPDPTATDGGTLLSNYPNTGVLNSGTTVIEDDTRSAIFRVTGGCYFWQFTFFDGDPNGVYTGAPTPSGVPTTLVSSAFSHHKLTNFEYACFYDLSLYYQKATRAFSQVGIPTTDPLAQRTEENRIVGPGGIQADTTRISTITYNGVIATATTVKASDGVTRVAHGFSVGSQVRIFNSDDAVSGVTYNGSYQILAVSSSLNDTIYDQYSYQLSGVPNANAQKLSTAPYLACELETDTVDSASPYIFNCSIRSTYGICGMHANGALATGFKSMVVAQYTGICLQKDDRAFVRACPAGSSNYQDGSITTCSGNTLRPAHQDINSQYKKGWRNYHVKASNDSYIQVVSVFAVGFADQFLTDTGGDMSIANSDSNFGNVALRAKGYKATAFTKDISGYISHIIPPANLPTAEQTINWLPFDIQLTRNGTYNPSGTKLYIYGAGTSSTTPITNVLGFTVGGKVNDTLYVGLGTTIASAVVNPSGPSTKTVGVGQTGSPIQWDSTANNWYISVNAGSTIVSTLQQSQYASPSQVTTPVSYFTRINDSRVPNDKIYRLRLVIPKTSTFASPPQTGFVIQPLGGVNSYSNTYYIFNVETYQSLVVGSQDGIYYLTALLGNISPTANNFNDTKFSQNVNQLYPTEDIDNPVSDPVASKSVADNITIGLVTTTNGSTSAAITDRSVTKESIIQWCKESNNSYTIVDNSGSYNYYDPSYTISVNGNTLTSGSGSVESRLINTSDVNVELRRPSIIRAGNQTFEYTGFGPGNYSTGFPSRQTVVLTDDQVRLSQSLRENGGIAFYSGLNANGDLFVGNTIINPVTGTTTTVNNPTTSSATDPNSPVFTNVTVTKAITVIGDSNNSATSIFSGPISVAGRITSSSHLELNPTWNTPSVKQTAIQVNVADTASASNSNLIDLQVSGASKFSVDKNGNTTINGTLTGTGVTTSVATYARQAITVSNSGTAGSNLTYNNTTGVITFGTSTLQQVTTSGNSSSNAISISNSTSSTSTTTGALVVTGGVGIGDALNVGGNIVGAGISGTTGTFSSSVSASSYGTVNATSISSSGTITGTGISGSSLSVSGSISGSTGSFSSSTASSSTTTGAVVITGGVGIGGALNVGGDVVAFASSDKRLKDNVSPITNPLEKLEILSGNTFTWNKNSELHGQSDVGVIAQEVEKVLPEIVATRDNGYLAVRYEKLVPLLIEAVKELSEKVRKLENDITK
jgi:Chaperone of endosialidase